MCKYCEELKEEGLVKIFDKPIVVNKVKIGYIESWLCGHNSDMKDLDAINLNVAICDSESGNYIYDIYKPIKYCPFCGCKY